jgi:hypothetical protein
VIDAASDQQVQLIPLGDALVQPVDICYNAIDGLIYTANRLTFQLGVLPAGGPACPADYNQDGGIDGSDIEAFFVDWEAGLSGADTNQDGGIDGADIGAFFTLWSAGGC